MMIRILDFTAILLVLFVASYGMCKAEKDPGVLNVMDFDATGDGETDDTKAFTKAWEALCKQEEEEDEAASSLLVPGDYTYLVQPLLFHGPCTSTNLHLKIEGNLVAPSRPKEWPQKKESHECWLCFENVNGLFINGSGSVNANGETWWDHVSHSQRPRAMLFRGCHNIRINGLTHLNSPKNHISIHNVKNATLSNLKIMAPEESPNTDGIDISLSSNVHIIDTSIGTGDDCVAINGGCSYINITNMDCGPGHGISVGSLGKDGAEEKVEHVSVRNCSFNGTQNGARIKTWEGGSGFARNILFEDITLIGSKHPIIIDQHYCNGKHNCPPKETAVKVSNVTYRHFTGTSADEEAISLNCSEEIGCNDIVFEDIKLTYSKDPNRELSASCSSASVRTKQVSVNISCPDSLTPAPAPLSPDCPSAPDCWSPSGLTNHPPLPAFRH